MNEKVLLHYVVVYGVLLLSWVPLMNKFNDVAITSFVGFVVFVVADQIAHKVMGID